MIKNNNSRIESVWNNASIQKKLMFSFFIPIMLILSMNIYIYINVNSMIARIDQIYVSNVTLSELSDQLSNVQVSTREYLENKGSTALAKYYEAEQDYRDSIQDLGNNLTSNSMAVMQKNITRQSEKYLSLINETIQAKRGRNVEKYRTTYEQSEVLYMDLQNCIYSLNNEQFKVNASSYYVLLSSLKYMETISITILVIIGVVNIIVIYLLTRSMTYPLIELSHAANEVADGNFEVDIAELDGNDEISVVSNAFSQMVERLQLYIEEIRDSMKRESDLKEHELVMESRMKEVELRNLQAQINPHFLFNTLNAGAQLAMMEDADKTTDFIQNMADFFRYNLKKINMDTSIEEEVSLVDKYIYILNVRFTGEIHYDKQVDESVLKLRIPSMVLQPIVENAVNYGIRNIDWEGHIYLNISRDGDMVYLSVKDNGIGMKQEDIELIKNGQASEVPKPSNSDSNGVGLANVIERLQIFTGNEDVVDIISEGEGKGTEVVIKIPFVE
ncbi:MAG: histidine kinase [Lachnospiraceae bacterium]|nr:histidine kinase [Candidatus Colinaster scatohippi]